jgi:hypothetical protein
MLKEVEMPQPLDLGVVDLVFARSLGVSKAAARHEIDVDGRSPLPSIEVHRLRERVFVPSIPVTHSRVIAVLRPHASELLRRDILSSSQRIAGGVGMQIVALTGAAGTLTYPSYTLLTNSKDVLIISTDTTGIAIQPSNTNSATKVFDIHCSVANLIKLISQIAPSMIQHIFL